MHSQNSAESNIPRRWNEPPGSDGVRGTLSATARAALILEFLLLFVLAPLAYRFSPVHLPPLPVLWMFTGYTVWQLLRNRKFHRTRLWNAGKLPAHLVSILAAFAVGAVLLWLGVHRFAPALAWNFIRGTPGFWALMMVAYPVLSVYPQELLYRAFFFTRYAPLFPGKWAMIVASATAFAFLHIIFRNPLAVALTFAGGLIFATRYAHTNSVFISSFEHALYGCWLFTVGLGQFFCHGVIDSVGAVLGR